MTSVIRLKDHGPEVEKLQSALNKFLVPSPNLRTDGMFGPRTESAVKTYQRERNLEVDGIAGPRTWAALSSETFKTPLLRGGENGEAVRRLQDRLNLALPSSSKVEFDGVFGRGTRKAVMSYQALAGIGVDGVVGPETWDSLLNMNEVQVPKLRPKTPTPGQIAPWIDVAKREFGQKEARGASEHNPKIIAYHATTTYAAKTDEVPWCSSFVNWVLKESGVEGTNSAAAASWLDWGQRVESKPGAITVIYMKNANRSLSSSGNHVGFLLRETSKHYVILGGNQGDQVKESHYPKSSWQLRGYRWPEEAGK